MADAEGVDISWKENDRYWLCEAEYGDAKIILISKSETGSSQLETLVQGLPQILHQVHISMQEAGKT